MVSVLVVVPMFDRNDLSRQLQPVLLERDYQKKLLTKLVEAPAIELPRCVLVKFCSLCAVETMLIMVARAELMYSTFTNKWL